MGKSIVFVWRHWTLIKSLNTQTKDTQGKIFDLQEVDLPLAKRLLQSNGLPFEDCYEHIGSFIGFFYEAELIAIGGIEILGNIGLLRSIAVQANRRGQGIGLSIVQALQQRATQLGIETLYLLTESAADYFHSQGYQFIDREKLPAGIKQTKQFQSLCPSSAQAMFIRLQVTRF